MKNNFNTIQDAINSHSQFSPNQKEVLSILLNLALEGEVIANINDIKKLSKSTRATISTAIAFLNKYGAITNSNINGKKFTGCHINKEKIDEIVAHYNKKKNLSQR